jgi:hypothetical protein
MQDPIVTDEQDKRHPRRCGDGFTRDDLRHFLFFNQARAVLDLEAEQVAAHLESGCSSCNREVEFLAWTEPGLTAAGRSRYDKLMADLQLGPDEVPQPVPQEQLAEHPLAFAEDPAIASLRVALDGLGNVAPEESCLEIVEALSHCFPSYLNSEQSSQTELTIRNLAKSPFGKLPRALKNRATDVISRLEMSQKGAVFLTEIAKEDAMVMLAITLQLLALIPAAQPFPITQKDGRLIFNPTAYRSGINVRLGLGQGEKPSNVEAL